MLNMKRKKKTFDIELNKNKKTRKSQTDVKIDMYRNGKIRFFLHHTENELWRRKTYNL